MTTKISAWGNSAGIRLPKVFMDALELNAGDSVELELVGKKLIITPEKEPTLAELMATIKPEQFHECLVDFEPVGKEIW